VSTENHECENCRSLEDEVNYLTRELNAIDDREGEIYDLDCQLDDAERKIEELECELEKWKGHTLDYYMLMDLADKLLGKTKQDIVDILKEYRIEHT